MKNPRNIAKHDYVYRRISLRCALFREVITLSESALNGVFYYGESKVGWVEFRILKSANSIPLRTYYPRQNQLRYNGVTL